MYEFRGLHWAKRGWIINLLPLLLLMEPKGLLADSQTATYYMLLAPGNLSPNQKFNVLLHIYNLNEISKYEISITGSSLHLRQLCLATYTLPHCEHHFEIPEIEKGAFYLRITTLKGFPIENSTSLDWNGVKEVVRLQLPKELYRPGQFIQFRAIFLNDLGQPINPDPTTIIWVEDGMHHTVKVFQNLNTLNGVFEGELHIGSQVNYGRWRICIRNQLRTIHRCYRIRVAEYTLPSIKLSMTAPARASIMNGALPVKISAIHDREGQVQGPISLNATAVIPWSSGKKIFTTISNGTLVNGEVTFFVAVQQYYKFVFDFMPMDLYVTAFVYDKQTDQLQNVTKVVEVWKTNNFAFGSDDEESKSMEETDSEDQLEDEEGEDLLDDQEQPVTGGRQRKVRSTKERVNLFNEKINLIRVYGVGDPLPDPLHLDMTFSKSLYSANCLVIVHRDIVGWGLVHINPYNNRYDMNLQMTRAMYPLVKVYIYSITRDFQMLAIAKKLIFVHQVDQELIFREPLELNAGEEFTLHINSLPYSYIGISAIDNRMAAYPSLHNPDEMLGDDLLILSNVPKTSVESLRSVTYALNKKPREVLPVKSTKISKFGTKFGSAFICCEVPDIDRGYQDVWIFTGIENDETVSHEYKDIVPRGIHNWLFTGFSMDQEFGLTFLRPNHFISAWTTNALYLSATVPYSLRVGETMVLPVTCYNWEPLRKNIIIRLRPHPKFRPVDKEGLTLRGPPGFNRVTDVASNGSTTVEFRLRAVKVGRMDVVLSLISTVARDGLHLHVEILPPILIESHIMFHYSQLTAAGPDETINWRLPHQPTDQGVHCYVTAHPVQPLIADMQTVEAPKNAEELVSKLLSIHYMHEYLKDKSWCKPEYKKFLEQQLSDGIQALMRYRRSDSGFRYNTIERKVDCAPAWLTNYVLGLMYNLDKAGMSLINDASLRPIEQFLMKQMGSKEQFHEHCPISDRSNISVLGLTKEVLDVLQNSKHLLEINKAEKWYLLEMLKEQNIYHKVQREDNVLEWQPPDELKIRRSWKEYRRHLEIAGHILYTTVVVGERLDQKEAIFKWLMTQKLQDRNFNCFECSVAEKGIYEFLKTMAPRTSYFNISFSINSEKQFKVSLNAKNQNIEQVVDLKMNTRTFDQTPKVTFEARGSGPYFVRCTYDYSPENPKRPLYDVNLTPTNATSLKLCIQRFWRERTEYVGTDLELHLPSGYVLQASTIVLVRQTKLVAEANVLKGNTKISINIHELQSVRHCFNMAYKREEVVEDLMNGTVKIADRYRPESTMIITFKLD